MSSWRTKLSDPPMHLTATMDPLMLPKTFEAFFLTEAATINAIYCGTVAGRFVLWPGLLVQMPPHSGLESTSKGVVVKA
ncbi:MAG TPA: hypothetical protein VN476_12115 [Pyrinomonadaceae bacterium]|nr:hypothetical protein [Pyrinomonadaceae bacterium]